MDSMNQDASARQVPAKRRRYADDFKREAVRLIVAEGYSFRTAAEAVGVTEQTLRAWHAKLAPKPEPCGGEATGCEQKSQNKTRRRDLKKAEMEREILKKATAYFAKESR